jgi:M6 family metalloprotease-like protein
MGWIFLIALGVPVSSDADTWNILALRVSFPQEEPDHPTTTGDGTFDLRAFEGKVREEYTFPYDTPPHNKGFYDLHLEALANYYSTVSEGRVELTFKVFPQEPDSSYRLPRTMIDYGSGRSQEAQDRKLVELFRDAVALADSVEGGHLDFGDYQSFLVIHAGAGKETSGALNDIPSAYLSMEDLEQYIGGPIEVGDGSQIQNGWIVPESVGFRGNGGLNGLMAKMFGHQLGLPVLSNLKDGLPALGGWSLMDVGDMNYSPALAVRDSTGAVRDSSIVVGFVPCHPMAWAKGTLGWTEPLVVRRDTTVQLAAAHIASGIPKVVKVLLNAQEHFLLENREAHYSGKGLPDGVTFSNLEDSSGVWMAVANYDAFIPGSGIFIYHIDEQVIEQGRATHQINADPMHRGIDLEEADGGEDIGNPHRVYADWEHPDWDGIDGEPGDAFFLGGQPLFGPDTTPSSETYGGADSGVRIEVLSLPGDTMEVKITFERNASGWPRKIAGTFGEHAPLWSDLDGDGAGELVVLSDSGEVFVRHGDGTPFFAGNSDGWFASTGGAACSGAASADLDGDGFQEIVVACADSSIICWRPVDEDADGAADLFSRVGIGFPVTSGPIVADLDGDPAELEIAIGGGEGQVALVNPGSKSVLWKVDIGPTEAIVGLAAANVDDAGQLDVIGATEEGTVFCISDREKRLLWHGGEHMAFGPVVGDIDLDDMADIVVVTSEGTVVALDARPEEENMKEGFPVSVMDRLSTGPVLGDINGDGYLEIVIGGTAQVHALAFNGVSVAGFPARLPLKDYVGAITSTPILADADGDGMADILFGTATGLVYGVNGQGELLPEFPLTALGPVSSSLFVADVDGEGRTDLGALTADGEVHVWKLNVEFRPEHIPWPMEGANPARTFSLPPSGATPTGSEDLLPSEKVYCYPNPVTGDRAVLRFYLGQEADIQVHVFNGVGELVDRMEAHKTTAQADNEIVWDTSDLESGLYLCRIVAKTGGRKQVVFVKAAVSE